MRRQWFAATLVFLSLSSTAVGQITRSVPMATPLIDGTISATEMASQLAVPMSWPVSGGSLLLEGSGSTAEELSATWYVSWNEMNLNISAVVADNTPDIRIVADGGNRAYNAQDVIQPVFSPGNSEFNAFVDGTPAEEDPVDNIAAIYDMVVNTADDFGPDIYRHGPLLTDEQHAEISIEGQETDTGYILEMALPWSVAMDDYLPFDPPYEAKLGDEHGLSFILLSFNGEEGVPGDVATLYTDFGKGENTIGDPSSWNLIELAEALEVACNPDSRGDLDGNGDVTFLDFLILAENFGETATDHTTGDIDCSGDVGFLDFLIMAENFGTSAAQAEAVPEPSSYALALLGALAMLKGRGRRREA